MKNFNAEHDELRIFQLENQEKYSKSQKNFLTVGNDLFMLNAGESKIYKIGHLDGQKISGDNDTLAILDIKVSGTENYSLRLVFARICFKRLFQASEWDGKIIIVTSLAHSYHIYMFSLLNATANLQPVQRLKKYGNDEKIYFFSFHGNLYCLLGSSSDIDQT